MRSTDTGVEVFTVGIANRCRPELALVLAMAGAPHSVPGGGNSSHMRPVVQVVEICPREAGDEKSCGPPDARPDPLTVLPGRASWNRMSFPAAAAVTSTLTRTPVSHSRLAAVPYSDMTAVAVVAATACDPDRPVYTSL